MSHLTQYDEYVDLLCVCVTIIIFRSSVSGEYGHHGDSSKLPPPPPVPTAQPATAPMATEPVIQTMEEVALDEAQQWERDNFTFQVSKELLASVVQ